MTNIAMSALDNMIWVFLMVFLLMCVVAFIAMMLIVVKGIIDWWKE